MSQFIIYSLNDFSLTVLQNSGEVLLLRVVVIVNIHSINTNVRNLSCGWLVMV